MAKGSAADQEQDNPNPSSQHIIPGQQTQVRIPVPNHCPVQQHVHAVCAAFTAAWLGSCNHALVPLFHIFSHARVMIPFLACCCACPHSALWRRSGGCQSSCTWSCLRLAAACQAPPPPRCPLPWGLSRRACWVSTRATCMAEQTAPWQASLSLRCVLPRSPTRAAPPATGGLLSGALFQYPGAVIMTALGIASARVLQTAPAWLVAASSGKS